MSSSHGRLIFAWPGPADVVEAAALPFEVLPGPTVRLSTHDAPEPDMLALRPTAERWLTRDAGRARR